MAKAVPKTLPASPSVFKTDGAPVKLIKVLIVEDNPDESRLIERILSVKNGISSFIAATVRSAGAACQRLSQEPFDVVLLDLGLPDSRGIHTFHKIIASARHVPIVVLTVQDNEKMAEQALRDGAQDYLIKEQLDQNWLLRSIAYAIERNHLQQKLLHLSLNDELTGLYNRRGFLSLAEQQLKLAVRNRKELVLIFSDLDKFKQINDRFGHQEGDMALITIARLFKESFRNSDIIARFGGDEFAILAIDASKDHLGELLSRFYRNLKTHNDNTRTRYELSLSLGMAIFHPQNPVTVEVLMSQADAALYEEKSGKKNREFKTSEE